MNTKKLFRLMEETELARDKHNKTVIRLCNAEEEKHLADHEETKAYDEWKKIEKIKNAEDKRVSDYMWEQAQRRKKHARKNIKTSRRVLHKQKR